MKSANDRKSKNPNLVWIDKPSKSENGPKNSLKVAFKILNMIDDDFNLTISDLCSIFNCERKWVENNIKPNVKHIFLNQKIRIFLRKIILEKNIDTNNMLKDYYFFSRRDLALWLKKNTKIYRQTIVIDLVDFSNNPGNFKLLKQHYINDLENTTSLIQKLALKNKFNNDILDLLTETGIELFNEVKPNNRNCELIDVTNTEDIPSSLVSVKHLRNLSGQSNEMIYRSLYAHGALKYVIADSLVRYDADYISKSIPPTSEHLITIPYSLYIKNIKSQ
ncbi:hypothetical protein [Clostridium baratii]|uniref:hypothetical protein n=1 Tax=Clostridium baratii TaxID=1561 RepID=UPI0005F2CA23|nr:hypothetical protein [Clostridium baratii]AQM58582.1 hypothetical protein NPD11_3103 [Clostridium baratii]KJU72392.1 hypothetical protein UC77_04475 [Clostridium baratii]